jgi:hypothetical protein
LPKRDNIPKAMAGRQIRVPPWPRTREKLFFVKSQNPLTELPANLMWGLVASQRREKERRDFDPNQKN